MESLTHLREVCHVPPSCVAGSTIPTEVSSAFPLFMQRCYRRIVVIRPVLPVKALGLTSPGYTLLTVVTHTYVLSVLSRAKRLSGSAGGHRCGPCNISGVTSVATVDRVPSQDSGQTLVSGMNCDKESHAWEWTPVVTCGHRLNGLPRRWRTCACQMASPGVVGHRFCATRT